MHNLDFYREFMKKLHEAIHREDTETFIQQYATNEQADLLLRASEGGK